jgi:hypothetical protein
LARRIFNKFPSAGDRHPRRLREKRENPCVIAACHSGIDAALPEQFLMVAVFDDHSLIQDVNAIAAHGADPVAAARANLIVEEAAQIVIFAEVLGGAKEIPAHLLKATMLRRDEFARAGTKRT